MNASSLISIVLLVIIIGIVLLIRFGARRV